MNWLVWKQHRKLFMILAGVLMLYAALAIPMGLNAWHTYQHALAACGKTDSCGQLSNNVLWNGWTSSINPNSGHGVPLLLLLPFLLGMFVGVPLIAREYNEKTNLLVWTRSISRRKWLTTKLVWILIATVLFAGTLTALTTWWAKAGNELYMNRFTELMFDIQGIAPIGFSVFAVSIGIALGTWLKRTMVAIGLTLLLVLAAQVVIGNHVRPHYMNPTSKTIVTNQFGGPNFSSSEIPTNAMVISSQIKNMQGQVLNWANPPKACIVPQDEMPGLAGNGTGFSATRVGGKGNIGSIISMNGGPAVKGSCLESEGYRYIVEYQPANRYWDFQRIELALYVALSIIPIGATYWLVLRRDA
jgi:ABC-type transport system involved in multi-copper enzyme maturation permease subunit